MNFLQGSINTKYLNLKLHICPQQSFDEHDCVVLLYDMSYMSVCTCINSSFSLLLYEWIGLLVEVCQVTVMVDRLGCNIFVANYIVIEISALYFCIKCTWMQLVHCN